YCSRARKAISTTATSAPTHTGMGLTFAHAVTAASRAAAAGSVMLTILSRLAASHHEERDMAQLLILTSAVDSDVLPALSLLSHTTKQIPASPASLVSAPTCDLIFVDARNDLASAKSLCKI